MPPGNKRGNIIILYQVKFINGNMPIDTRLKIHQSSLYVIRRLV